MKRWQVGVDGVKVRDREKWTDAAKPAEFFTIAGYAPATMQMLMVRLLGRARLARIAHPRCRQAA